MVKYIATNELGNEVECNFAVEVKLREPEIEISKIITPDGDGFNDFLKIANIENYPNNNVTIFDRWGSVIFAASGYDNGETVWRGQNKNSSIVPSGTYFYFVEVTYGRQKLKWEGFIELLQ
jgi:gliding motility-associated-like protein